MFILFIFAYNYLLNFMIINIIDTEYLIDISVILLKKLKI